MNFNKAKITIDLDEYNHLNREIENKNNENKNNDQLTDEELSSAINLIINVVSNNAAIRADYPVEIFNRYWARTGIQIIITNDRINEPFISIKKIKR